ncbi:UDP-4-amino-4,6-dideoxy-N-acetyl-beta-L-altrosamine N-acetyltransferase [Clostridium cellulovorans]|uniref:UDP-4-amino-4, 6-dideoxy-N-acetyl-beta-L-altrosamine N-acetyltransferase n=1 Tax=Clostridium cellulovorans TaxID=1493 RepID=UPI001F60FF97|nr:UDP-4-amino-4,6-dideoxy-N-acetyl-beta-L-altrosamine N-acetyltransferase [Clostridium cellulovorans]
MREINKDDTTNIIEWRNSNEVRKFFIDQQLLTEEIHMSWLKSNVETGRAKQFIIVLKEEELPIGSVFLKDIDLKNSKAEFGIFIGEEFGRGKGHGREALKIIVDYGFKVMKLNKIFLRVLEENKAAIKCYQSAGFVYEGIFKDDIKSGNQYKNLIFMALFNK